MTGKQNGNGGMLTPLQMNVILIYCLANVGMMVLDTFLDSYAVYFYFPKKEGAVAVAGTIAGQLAPLALAGLALNFGRVIDAIANPIVGFLSDRTNTRWGRRIPYTLFGAIPMTAFFILMFFPPIDHNSRWNALWFAFTCGCFLFLYTLVVAPYLALIPEIATTSDDRVKLSSWHAFASMLGLIIFYLSGFLLIDKLGIRTVAIIMSLFSLATILVTAFKIKEKPIDQKSVARMSFWKAVMPALKNKHFLIYAFSISSFWLGYKVLQSSIIFVNTVILKKSEGYMNVIMGGMLLVLLLSIPLVFFLYNKFGKKKMFIAGLVLMMILSFLQAFVVKSGEFMNPVIYYHIIVALTGFPIALMLVIYNAVLSDIIDYDATQTGYRREAMYYGMEGLFTKTARGIGSSMSGILFAVFGLEIVSNTFLRHITVPIKAFISGIGMDAGAATGLLLAGPFCAIFALIGVIIFSRYSLSD